MRGEDLAKTGVDCLHAAIRDVFGLGFHDPAGCPRDDTLLVGPVGDPNGAGHVRQKCRQFAREGVALAAISFQPMIEVAFGCQHVGLLLVARGVGQHEVMGKIAGIFRPRDEMVDVSRSGNGVPTVEAFARLQP